MSSASEWQTSTSTTATSEKHTQPHYPSTGPTTPDSDYEHGVLHSKYHSVDPQVQVSSGPGLDIAGATSPSTPGTYSLETPIVEHSPSRTPWSTHKFLTAAHYSSNLQYASHNRGTFELAEVQFVFPSDLPARPEQKPGLFARLFKRKVKKDEDIELGDGHGAGAGAGAGVVETPRCKWRQKIAGSPAKQVLIVSLALFVTGGAGYVLGEMSLYNKDHLYGQVEGI